MNVLQPPPPPPMMPDYNGLLGRDDIGGFRYGVGVSIGVLLLITTITLTSYFCTRNQLSSSPSQTNQDSIRVHHHHHHVIIDVVSGLDEDTIQSYPKILYSEAKGHSTASCCPICLGDYKGKHLLRQLPDCKHLFHLKCIDTWLRLNPTCPVCRTSPLPTPLPTPLAEVVPLASTVATTRMS
uniref:RING-H2 finger protein ATL70 n=1 Tax=Noccaea caerulescens TaxID=107243 RepID=A0A1J3FSA7_NOCCA